MVGKYTDRQDIQLYTTVVVTLYSIFYYTTYSSKWLTNTHVYETIYSCLVYLVDDETNVNYP